MTKRSLGAVVRSIIPEVIRPVLGLAEPAEIAAARRCCAVDDRQLAAAEERLPVRQEQLAVFRASVKEDEEYFAKRFEAAKESFRQGDGGAAFQACQEEKNLYDVLEFPEDIAPKLAELERLVAETQREIELSRDAKKRHEEELATAIDAHELQLPKLHEILRGMAESITLENVENMVVRMHCTCCGLRDCGVCAARRGDELGWNQRAKDARNRKHAPLAIPDCDVLPMVFVLAERFGAPIRSYDDTIDGGLYWWRQALDLSGRFSVNSPQRIAQTLAGLATRYKPGWRVPTERTDVSDVIPDVAKAHSFAELIAWRNARIEEQKARVVAQALRDKAKWDAENLQVLTLDGIPKADVKRIYNDLWKEAALKNPPEAFVHEHDVATRYREEQAKKEAANPPTRVEMQTFRMPMATILHEDMPYVDDRRVAHAAGGGIDRGDVQLAALGDAELAARFSRSGQ